MRFHDIRKTLIKRTDDIYAPEMHAMLATPRLLSPFLPGGIKVREGVQTADILQPKYNRSRRRANGMRRPHSRLGGVSIPRSAMPWKHDDAA